MKKEYREMKIVAKGLKGINLKDFTKNENVEISNKVWILKDNNGFRSWTCEER